MSGPRNPAPPALVALALFAEAISDPSRRRGAGGNAHQLLRDAYENPTRGVPSRRYDALPQDVKDAFVDLFDSLTPQEIDLLAKLQERFSGLEAHGLAEQVEVGSFRTLAKL